MVPELLIGVESERTMAVTGLSQGSTPVLGASPSVYHTRDLLDSPAVSPPSPGVTRASIYSAINCEILNSCGRSYSLSLPSLHYFPTSSFLPSTRGLTG